MLKFLSFLFAVSYTALRNFGLGFLSLNFISFAYGSSFLRSLFDMSNSFFLFPSLLFVHMPAKGSCPSHSCVVPVGWLLLIFVLFLFVLLYNKHINNNECNPFTMNPLGLRKTAPHTAALRSSLLLK